MKDNPELRRALSSLLDNCELHSVDDLVESVHPAEMEFERYICIDDILVEISKTFETSVHHGK